MQVNFLIKRILLFLLIIMLPFITNCQHETSLQPERRECIDDQPVEDTTRVYVRNIVDVDGTVVKADTIPIYPKAIFARFYPWVQDTAKIRELAEKHHLRLWIPPESSAGQLTAILCVTDDRRAEYHFTPYDQEGFCNFGADSLVEYAFGVFGGDEGRGLPTGQIIFKFEESTPHTRIDSLFEAEGLRFLHTNPDIPSGTLYTTVVTSNAKKNVLDLGNDLNFVPFVIYASVAFGIVGGNPPISCEK